MTCPCGGGRGYADCCGVFLDGRAFAPDPERLMRSRYVAYALGRVDYIVETTDPQVRLDVDRASVERWMSKSEFTGLEVLGAGAEGNRGTVEFVAHYRDADGSPRRHHELSQFRRQGGRWFFRKGRVRSDG